MIGPVRDNTELKRFELDADGLIAFVTYRIADGVLTFLHEEVPHAVEGKGVGTALARGALDIVRSSGMKVIPRCPFIAHYIRQHPEYQDLLAK